jgi:hypothetical protein
VTQAEAAELKGGIKGEPDTTLRIQVKNVEGARYVTRITFKDIPVQCESGPGSTSGTGSAGEQGEPGLEVESRKFSGPWKFGEVKGKFKGGGKLTGILSISKDAGAPQGDCNSGKLDYVVRD